MARYDTRGDKILLGAFYVLLLFVGIVMVYPFWEQLVISVSSRADALRYGLHLFTLHPTLDSYARVLQSREIWRGFGNTVYRTVIGTALSVFLTALTAYPLSKRYFPGMKTFTALVLFTMMFNGGLIPTYLLIKSLGMLNTRWSLILPPAVGAWNLIIMRNFFRSVPASLEESARMDGASEFTVWWRIVVPLSKPVLATVALWVAVYHWNAYFDSLIYITDTSKQVIQVTLRRILLEDQVGLALNSPIDVTGQNIPPSVVTKAAVVMVATLPIVCVYPFLQKYFVKGIMLGSVKG